MDETVEANVQVFEHPNAVRIEIIITGARPARLELKVEPVGRYGGRWPHRLFETKGKSFS